MFCYICILQWLDGRVNPSCPTCRAPSTVSDIISLHWDPPIPRDTQNSIASLENQLQKTLEDKQAISRELDAMKLELARERSQMVDLLGEKEPPRTPATFRSRFPAILLEVPVSRARRVCVADNAALVCCSWDTDGKRHNGIQIFSGGARVESMEIHSVPLWDAAKHPIDRQKIATVATDKQVIVSDYSVREQLSGLTTEDPLFSCDWVTSDVVIAGGARGSLHLYDTRAREEVTNIHGGQARPFTGVAVINERKVAAVAPDAGVVFDIRNCVFERGCCVDGGMHVQCCQKIGLTTVVASGSVSFLNYSEADGLRPQTVLQCQGLSRAMVSMFDREVFSVFAEKPNSFKLVRMRRLDVDVWGKWRHFFQNPDHPSPIVDLAMVKEGSHVNVFSLSAELLRITSIPVC